MNSQLEDDNYEPVRLPYKLRQAMRGHPYAKIPWPHRILGDSADYIEQLEQRVHHLEECVREVAYPLVIGANHARERYPLMYDECDALLRKEKSQPCQ